MIKAIETKYKGYRFRSRLEARWAVFFDHIELKWEYEKEGFDIDGVLYLPDFYFPTLNLWAEVKPSTFSEHDFDKIAALDGLVLDGNVESRVFILAGKECSCQQPPMEMNVLRDIPATYCYKCYMAGEKYWGCDLVGSVYKGRYWYAFGDTPCYTDELAVNAARSARFEFGESGA